MIIVIYEIQGMNQNSWKCCFYFSNSRIGYMKIISKGIMSLE
jgi:hypothetical protein